jgi:hypothetical protein
MKSPIFFIVKPKGDSQYVNNNDGLLVRNTSIEDAKDVNRVGIVHAVPTIYNTIVDIGDEVVLHHNTFRITFNQKGIPVHSNSYISDNLYFVYPEMIYMVIKPNGEKISLDPFCFVTPMMEDGEEIPNVGTLKYGNKFTKENNLLEGTDLFLKEFSNYEFNFDNERLYRVRNNQILATV